MPRDRTAEHLIVIEDMALRAEREWETGHEIDAYPSRPGELRERAEALRAALEALRAKQTLELSR